MRFDMQPKCLGGDPLCISCRYQRKRQLSYANRFSSPSGKKFTFGSVHIIDGIEDRAFKLQSGGAPRYMSSSYRAIHNDPYP